MSGRKRAEGDRSYRAWLRELMDSFWVTILLSLFVLFALFGVLTRVANLRV